MSEIVKTHETNSGFQIEITIATNDSEIIIKVELQSPPDKDNQTYDLYRKVIRSFYLLDASALIQDVKDEVNDIIETLVYTNESIDPVVEVCRLTRNGVDYDLSCDSEHYRMMTNCINYTLSKK